MGPMPEDISSSKPIQPDWDRIAATPQFRSLISTKKFFVVPVFLLFLTYFFTLPVLLGLAPHAMSKKVFGGASLAYVFAISQFFVAWFVAWRYIKFAGKLDARVEKIVEDAGSGRGDA